MITNKSRMFCKTWKKKFLLQLDILDEPGRTRFSNARFSAKETLRLAFLEINLRIT